MNIELCDLCKEKEANRKFKIKTSKKGYYQRIASGMKRCNSWKPYEKIYICDNCARKLFSIKSDADIEQK